MLNVVEEDGATVVAGLGLGKDPSDRSCNLSREVAGFVLLLLTTGTGNVPSSFAVIAP